MRGNIWLQLMALGLGWALLVALLVSILTAVVMVVRDRRRRKRSGEAAVPSEIDILERTGKITGEEAQFLRQQADRGPEAGAKPSPPNLPLRLAAAVSRIHVVMVLLALAVPVVLDGWLLARFGSRISNMVDWNRFLREFGPTLPVFGWWLALLIASVGLWIASRRVRRGRPGARFLMAVMWLVYLVCLGWMFDMYYRVAAVGIFVLWMLYRGAGAVGKRPRVRGWRRWVLPVVGIGVLLFGLGRKMDFLWMPVQIWQTSGYGDASGTNSAARLERLHILCGTPDASVRAIAGKLTSQLCAAGYPAVLHEADEIPVIDSGREAALWIGRGTMAASDDARTRGWNRIFDPKPDRRLIGAPCFNIFSLGTSNRSSPWRGFSLPHLYFSFHTQIAVYPDRSEEATDEVVRRTMEPLLAALKLCVGPWTFRMPDVPLPEATSALPSLPLRNFHPILRSRGVGGGTDVYSFSVGDDCESDRNAVREFLTGQGFQQQYESDGALHFIHFDQQDVSTAVLYGWRPGATSHSSFGFGTQLELPVGLLSIETLAKKESEPDPAFATRFFAADPVTFLCSGGLAQLAPAERETALAEFFARNNMPRFVRMKVLQSAMSGAFVPSEREKTLLEREFKRLAGEVVAAGPAGTLPEDVDALRELARHDSWRELEPWLEEEIGDYRLAIDLGKEPDDRGVIVVEKELKSSEGGPLLRRLDFSFGTYPYEPKSAWVGVVTDADGRLQIFNGIHHCCSYVVADRNRDSLFCTQFRVNDGLSGPPLRLMEASSSMGGNITRTPAPGGLLLTGRYDIANAVLHLTFVFLPYREEDTLWETRLKELPYGDAKAFADGILELTRELRTRSRHPAFIGQVKKLLTACPDPALRRRIGDVLGESYCRIELPPEPDADGVYRGRAVHPVNSVTDVQVVCEIDGGADANAVVLVGYGVGPEEGGTFWRFRDEEMSSGLSERKAAQDRLIVKGQYRANAPERLQPVAVVTTWDSSTTSPPPPPNPGEYQLIATPDQANGLLEFSALYRPKAQ